MCWLPITQSATAYADGGFAGDKLICCTQEGCLLCLDSNSRLFAAAQIDVTVLCIDSDGYSIFTGCSDGSVRVWVMEGGVFRDAHRFMAAHEKGVTSICVDKSSRILATGGGEGHIRIWKTYLN